MEAKIDCHEPRKPKADSIKLRFMEADEVGRLRELIAALGKFENATIGHYPDEKELTDCLIQLDKLGKPLSNKLGTFVVVALDENKSKGGTEQQGHIIGYMIYTQDYSVLNGRQFYLTSFFIEEAYRSRGVGTSMLEFMAAHGKAMGNEFLDVPFLFSNTVGMKFYEKKGGRILSDDYRLAIAKFNQIE